MHFTQRACNVRISWFCRLTVLRVSLVAYCTLWKSSINLRFALGESLSTKSESPCGNVANSKDTQRSSGTSCFNMFQYQVRLITDASYLLERATNTPDLVLNV